MIKSTTWMKLIGLIVIVGGGIVFFQMSSLSPSEIIERLREVIEGSGSLGPLVYIIAYTILPVIAFPGSLLTTLGGAAFGWKLGTVYTVFGATIGATMAFLVARFLGRGFVSKLQKGRIAEFDKRAQENGLQTMLFVRLIPLFPYNGVNFGAGLSSIRLRHFVVGSFIGMIPGSFAYNYFGSAIASGEITYQLWVALFFLGLLVITPSIYKRLKK